MDFAADHIFIHKERCRDFYMETEMKYFCCLMSTIFDRLAMEMSLHHTDVEKNNNVKFSYNRFLYRIR